VLRAAFLAYAGPALVRGAAVSAETEDRSWKRTSAGEKRVRFTEIASRSTTDYALRTVQQSPTHFSAMADAKANILITVCALLFTIGLTQLHRDEVQAPLLVLLSAAGISLMLAVLSVLPTAPVVSRPGLREPGRVPFNHIFFMHFSTLPLDEYLDEMDELLGDLPRFYEAIIRDIYGQGVALGRKKYRLLRWSYSVLLVGVASALLLLLAQQITG